MVFEAYASRLAAWCVSLALIGAGTAASVAGVGVFAHALPRSTSGSYTHVHGLIVAVETDETFAVQVPGQKALLWLKCAHGAPISMAHLERHLRERAPTDVRYEAGPKGTLLAMDAD